MKKLSLDDYHKLRRLVYRGANTLIFTQWRCAFENGDPEDVLSVLACYQNEDGGFGYALEANCWNPNSSPYMTSFAISIIDGLHYTFTDRNHPVLRGILKYLASGEYATETGWLGMSDIPTNNDYSHAPWFRYDPTKEPGVTDPKNIVNFILKYGEKDSPLYQKAQKIEKTIPKNKPIPDLSGYDPTKFICWESMPTDIVDSPDSPLYPEYKNLVDAELDGIVDRLHTIQELPIPGIDDKADWLDNRQIISCYPSTCGFFIMQVELLKKFNRLDFAFPVLNLFTAQINNWQEWGEIFQFIPAFTPLVEYILRKENLPSVKIENLTPGTNAVFKAGDYVVKIFAPAESGIDQTLDLQTELFSTRRANEIGVSAPKLIADGFVEDKYRFGYMITEYINGVELAEAVKTMSDEEKILVGQKLRQICDKMNTPCEAFNGIDIINDKGRYRRWNNYPERFKTERLDYIKAHDFGQNVFVHGDLCLDNILLSPEGELFIIDFADAAFAPVIYEHALAAYAFEFDPFLIGGYFGDYTTDGFIDMFFNGLLIHDFGGSIVSDYFGKPDEILSLDDLRERLGELIKRETEERA